jgi:hypothetical protein
MLHTVCTNAQLNSLHLLKFKYPQMLLGQAASITTPDAASTSVGEHCDNLRGLIQVVNRERKVETSVTHKSTVGVANKAGSRMSVAVVNLNAIDEAEPLKHAGVIPSSGASFASAETEPSKHAGVIPSLGASAESSKHAGANPTSGASSASAEAESSKHAGAITSLGASDCPKKVQDELPDDGCANGLYTPMPIDPRVLGTQNDAVAHLTSRVESIVGEDRMTKDHANVYKAFLKVAVKKGWGKTADKYGFASVLNITFFLMCTWEGSEME